MATSTATRPGSRQVRTVLEELPHGLLLTDADDRVDYANPRLAAVAGCDPAALVGRPVSELLAPAAGAAWPRPAAGDPESPGAEIELERPDGGRFWALVHAVPRAEGGWLRLVADIGERKDAESDQARLQKALTHAAREWQLTFDAVEVPLLVAAPDGGVARLNRAAQRLAGRDFAALIGQPVDALGEGEPWRSAAALAEQARASRRWRSLSTYDSASGKTWELAASVYATPAAGDDRVILVLRDITGLVRLQESLRRSEVMSALGTLVAGVAHEVRNPLFGLSAVLDAFESRFGDQEAHRSYLAMIRTQVQRLNALMQQLLDYGKPLALELAPGSLADAAAEAAAGCAALADERVVAVQVDAENVLPTVPMDRAKVVQAFQNLIENAVAHSPRGGRVQVTLEPGDEAAAEGGDRNDGDGESGRARWVAARVEDSGPGLPADDLERVFDPFFSRRRGGTGLGLSIVQRVIEQHGGRVRAGNRPEGGAQMELLLPTSPPRPESD